MTTFLKKWKLDHDSDQVFFGHKIFRCHKIFGDIDTSFCTERNKNEIQILIVEIFDTMFVSCIFQKW